MGGALAIASSVLIPEVDAAVGFYGTPSSELADPAQAKAPIQAHFGELDHIVGFSDVTVYILYYIPLITIYITSQKINCLMIITTFFRQQGISKRS